MINTSLICRNDNYSIYDLGAMKIMKIHVQRNIVWDDVRKPNSFNNTLCRKILELLADEGDVKRVNEFRDILLSSGLGEMNNVVLGPTIKVHVLKYDFIPTV